MSSFFNKMGIERLSGSQATYQKGVSYFRNGRVRAVEFEPIHPAYHAIVEGETTYEVMIYVDENNAIREADCDCPAFSAYAGYCKHIVAVLLYLEEADQSKQSPTSITRSELDRNHIAIQEIMSSFQTNHGRRASTSQLLYLQYFLKMIPSKDYESDRWFTVQLKAGSDKLYVVKNIRDFLNAFKQQRQLFFSSKFVYDPTVYAANAEDEKMLRFLLELHNDERVYRGMIDPWSGGRTDERILIIPPNKVSAFLKLLPKDKYLLEHDGKQYNELRFVENRCPVSFSLRRHNKYLVLQSEEMLVSQEDSRRVGNKNSELILLSQEGYCFDSGNIYELSTVQRDLILPLHRKIQRNLEKRLLIDPLQMEDVISVVLPLLKKEDCLTIEADIAEKLVHHPLKAEVYLDRRLEEGGLERLTAKISYIYGDFKLDPFIDEQPQDVLLIRDMEKEQRIMELFEEVNFKYNGQELYLEDEASLYRFLYRQMPTLKELGDIYTTDSVDQIQIQPQHIPVPRVEVNRLTNWLEFGFEIPDMTEEELRNIVKAFIERKSYYRSQDGTFVPFTGEMTEELMSLFDDEESQQPVFEGHKIKLPMYRSLQFDELVDHAGIRLNKGEQYRRLVRAIKDPQDLQFSPPTAMEPILRDYQRLGFQWMKALTYYQFGGILADDMGLGKTIQALAFVVHELENTSLDSVESNHVPGLVVAPASLIYNWEKECARFAPQLRTLVVAGSKEEREELLKNTKDIDLLITSYPLLRRDSELYSPFFFRTLILDEAQSFKNNSSQTFQSIKRIRSGIRFALSGTPIENSVEELWSIFDIVLPGLLPKKKAFRKLTTEQISRRVRPFILRRMKKDVLAELPDKIESNLLSELTVEQKKLYIATLEKIQKDAKRLLQEDGFNKSRMKILAGLTRLRQICCHPSLYVVDYTADSGKFDQFLELVQELRGNSRRVLVFSQFTSMLMLMQKRLEEEGISYHYLYGGTPAKERLDMVERFNAGEKELFLISLKAGGTGLNLTGADTVILYDLWWNPAVEQQAIDRAHRMGQKKTVQVFKLIAKGTIEEKIYELQQKKQMLVEQVIQPGDQVISTLTEADIQEILGL